ncbi:17497_t:CDS:2 [Funneliformis geosporum]|nr:17497_t:CDS:2 [Funneliformis geosporum]
MPQLSIENKQESLPFSKKVIKTISSHLKKAVLEQFLFTQNVEFSDLLLLMNALQRLIYKGTQKS